jgi:hypothetical protein
MGLLDYFRAPVTEADERTVPLAEHAAVVNQLEVVAESLAGLEQLAREDAGWRSLGMEQQHAFTRSGLLTIHGACLAAYIKSPLIGRGVRIRRNYVWGRGVELAARDVAVDDGRDTPVNDLIQALVESPEFKRVLGSAQAREERETNLGTAGEFFVLAVHDTASRTVRPRLVPPAQVVDYIVNPEDSQDVWFYKRQWTVTAFDLLTEQRRTVTRTEWHPTLEYRPPLRARLDLIAGKPVRWDQPILHCAVNAVTEAPWGVPDVYAAIDWARAYEEYLSGWAALMRALAKYAFKVTAQSKHHPKIRQALTNGAGPDPLTGHAKDQQVGGTALIDPSTSMAPMHSSGATIDADSGKPLAGMVAAALDVPITMLLADPGVTGARATAQTLDRPLELTTGSRQQLWTDWLKALFAHVIAVAVEDGILAGDVVQGPTRQLAVLPDDADGTVDVTFPPIEDVPLAERLQAIAVADGLPIPKPLIVRMALEALGVEDVDEVLDGLTDERGEFIDPRITAAAAAVQRERDGAPASQAAEAYR